jgi:hypothetical protein
VIRPRITSIRCRSRSPIRVDRSGIVERATDPEPGNYGSTTSEHWVLGSTCASQEEAQGIGQLNWNKPFSKLLLLNQCNHVLWY